MSPRHSKSSPAKTSARGTVQVCCPCSRKLGTQCAVNLSNPRRPASVTSRQSPSPRRISQNQLHQTQHPKTPGSHNSALPPSMPSLGASPFSRAVEPEHQKPKTRGASNTPSRPEHPTTAPTPSTAHPASPRPRSRYGMTAKTPTTVSRAGQATSP